MPSQETCHPGAGTEDAVWRPHVTVATIVARDDRFLLVEEDIRGRVQLNQPAGHLDPGETLADAARRETLEEAGWDIRLDHFVAVHQWVSPRSGIPFVRFTFAATPLQHQAGRRLDDGIIAVHWLTYGQIEQANGQLRSPLILASLDAWLGGQRLPLSALQAFGFGS